MPVLTQTRLAKLMREADALIGKVDAERSFRVNLVSALLELLGGRAYLPGHALRNASGYQTAPGERAGDLVLQLP